MNEDEFCNLTWEINSTGDLNTLWKLNVKFNATGATSNTTNNVTIKIGIVLIMQLSWDYIDFGQHDPLETQIAAPGNPTSDYIITLHNNSNNADGIWIKGTNLTNPNVTTYIGVGNVTWGKDITKPFDPPDYSTSTPLTGDYALIQGNVTSGTEIATYYWINIPGGIWGRVYTGSMTIMANATE